jgi:hypothetical protein
LDLGKEMVGGVYMPRRTDPVLIALRRGALGWSPAFLFLSCRRVAISMFIVGVQLVKRSKPVHGTTLSDSCALEQEDFHFHRRLFIDVMDDQTNIKVLNQGLLTGASSYHTVIRNMPVSVY